MEHTLHLFKVLFLLVLFFMGNAEARDCYEWSRKFKGSCLNGKKCSEACKNEGFTDGKCKFIKRYPRCSCTKPCPFNDHLP
ncbi:hypothetical protein RND71_006268 [Anisodus tanguticus]|uniref:Knottins-like domain-containing protein n=1 Tax=Anisodus tanguticus TaxID=243964 RepID=A0AAE1SVS5_9SOLA|nr:hypothetical protein RND71_006268 [Anisodus tanguticus]